MLRTICLPDGRRAGWLLTARETSDWKWGRAVRSAKGVVLRIEEARDCSEAEKHQLNYLLWTAQIAMRFQRVKERDTCPWAFASID